MFSSLANLVKRPQFTKHEPAKFQLIIDILYGQNLSIRQIFLIQQFAKHLPCQTFLLYGTYSNQGSNTDCMTIDIPVMR